MNQAFQDATRASLRGDTVREDLWAGRLVRLTMPLQECQDVGISIWQVEDVLSGRLYELDSGLIGPPINEMQALAFVASTTACSCCKSEGSRTYKVKYRDKIEDVCGACYRAVCDVNKGSCRKSGPSFKERV